ncbi:hypothetical protein JD844_003664 [Phrynosoma platyrhinos]|uniref:G-protein coupled receptors family 2 profile 2 domain-containing protein n=1 Tax=Phrynosoma platyrhinos TaxID=52577 RepID=A0ABQ7TDE7_PHRPL|nr:hypothetical protein JD844_003664 [Phrynosoma platyrhinos]
MRPDFTSFSSFNTFLAQDWKKQDLILSEDFARKLKPINFVFLFNIVRILMTKLRASTTSETIQYRKAVKATLVLLPLLGITYMLFFVNPGEDDISQIFFIYFNSFLQSFQGFFVSVFYCFLNGEVSCTVAPYLTGQKQMGFGENRRAALAKIISAVQMSLLSPSP